VIPQLPNSYTSDPHLKSFLKLLINGLSYLGSDRPSIYHFSTHSFLREADNKAAAGSYYN
jgi:hypothetical protein